MKILPVSSGRRPLLAGSLALAAIATALVTWAQNDNSGSSSSDQGQPPFGHLNSSIDTGNTPTPSGNSMPGQGPLPFGGLNSINTGGTPAATPPPTPTPAAAPAGLTSPSTVGASLKQVELASTSLQIVSLGGGVAFWDPIKRLIYVYPGDFSVCTGVYQMGTPGQPMQRVGP
ncbi:MAG: hypothetical protein ABSH19_08025 [Opitutales bacterium]|jgi:hypothetical protein